MWTTNDIALASYLVAMGCEILRFEVSNGTGYAKCTYYFETPDQKYLGAWLAGTATGNARELIQSYRHVLRDSRIEIEKVKSGTTRS